MDKELDIFNRFDVLKGTSLASFMKEGDISFLQEHTEGFEKRLRTRSIWRSKFEMEAAVLRDDEHPTPDSKYWQAIGEQAVHLQELITLTYEAGKHEADREILEADIAALEEDLVENEELSPDHSKVKAQIKKKKIEIEQNRFNAVMMAKAAKERMREIRDWEDIIEQLHPQLKHGDEDFGKHHAERYLKRYKVRMDRLQVLPKEDQENVIAHYDSFARHPDNKDLVQSLLSNTETKDDILPTKEHQSLQQPKVSCRKEYGSNDDMLKNEPVVTGFFKRKVKKIMIGALHRTKDEPSATNFTLLQPPAAMSVMLEEPYGFSVPDGRNFVIDKAIEEYFDFLFCIDNDVIVPRNTLVALMNDLLDGYDIASGFYYRKYMPLESCPMIEDRDGRPSRVEFEIGDRFDNPLVFCTGCTMFKVSALKRIEPPWYKDIFVNGRMAVSEDTYLCQQLRMLDPKPKVILDTGIQCIHVDMEKGVFYGHPDIIKNNAIEQKWREIFAI